MNDLRIQPENLERLFTWFLEDKLVVNRKYQRKLVWSYEEKQKFINSIAHEYPVPLILLAQKERAEATCYEIIDGMQRLDAVFCFLRGEFPINYNGADGYFDLTTFAATKYLLDSDELKQETPVLSSEICRNISGYQLPLSITPINDTGIEEIFRRINATGRQLSPQDLRQAGSVGMFTDLVRKIAIRIRRDSSPEDILPLSKMKEISLSSRKLEYGIDLNTVFWVRNKIITVDNMRLSRDEEQISHLLLYILNGPETKPTAKTLDIVFGFEEDENLLKNRIETFIERDGEERIITRFLYVFDRIEELLCESGKTFSELIFNLDEPHGKVRSFQVVFLAIYNILTSGKEIQNSRELIEALNGIGEREFEGISLKHWDATFRQQKINAVEGIIRSYFKDAEAQDPAVDNWVNQLENLLMQSKIEQQLFDFKIGFHDLQTKSFNAAVFSKVIKTLTAMANNGKNVSGYVIIGIADKQADAEEYKRVYGTESKCFNSFLITGVNGEIEAKYRSIDEYFNKIKQLIEAEPIDEYTKSYITRNMRLVNYYDKCVVVLSIKATTSPLLYDNKYFERRAANVHTIIDDTEIRMGDMPELFARFA